MCYYCTKTCQPIKYEKENKLTTTQRNNLQSLRNMGLCTLLQGPYLVMQYECTVYT